ncbi:helix-turn-helix protein [mine drainage metagenome]|uniref:Helix-turn-helix protein n=1 Tax=mine drainage metagenome TaxID=410659 RepID=A0A1J5QQ75_9ZZZZ
MADVVDAVTATPGMSRAAAARALHCRRSVALELVDLALAADLIHEDESTVAIRGRARRTVTGLYPGPAERALFAEPTLSGKQLRATRERAAVPPGILARHLHVSPAQLRRWETGAQVLPARMHHLVTDALEAAQDEIAQAALRPAKARKPRPAPERSNRRNDAQRLARLLRKISEQPGRSRWDLVSTRTIDRRLLEDALTSGQVHEEHTWTPRSRQPSIGVFPGPEPSPTLPAVLVADLAAARAAAGWSQDAIALRLGIARTTWARWEREFDVIPGWASATAAAALTDALAARRDDRAAMVRAAQEQPGLSRKALLAELRYTRWSIRLTRDLEEAIAAGELHERHADQRGQRTGVYPGPEPLGVLDPSELRRLRDRKGIKQRDLAAAIGTHVQAIRDWEGGHRPLSIDSQRRLLDYLEPLPDATALLRERVHDVIRERPRNHHQLELLNLGSRADLDAALSALVNAGEIHIGRIGAGQVDWRGRTTRGRVSYIDGPDEA